MSETPPPARTYILGNDSKEIERLVKQGQLLSPLMRRLLEDAGVSRGMKVLDLGCGPGEVSLIAAELVGEEGSVLGIDSNPTAIRWAQSRAQEAHLSQLAFQVADIRTLTSSQQFDAIIGRLILQYIPDPAGALRQLITHLRPGGLVAFQEIDIADRVDISWPSSPLWQQGWAWIYETYQRAGLEVHTGMKLFSAFLDAGLPAPQLRCESVLGTGHEWTGYEILTGVVRGLLPLIQQFGIASAEEVGIDSLTERLRDEVASANGVVRVPMFVSAWART